MTTFYDYSPLTTLSSSNNIQNEYVTFDNDTLFVNTYSVIASKFISAFTDEAGNNQDLMLAASSNVIIEGVDGVSMYFSEVGGSVKHFTSSNDENNVRHDTLAMQSFSSNVLINGSTSNVYVLETGDPNGEAISMLLKGTDEFQTVYVNDMRFMSGFNGDDQQHMDTTHSNFRMEKPLITNIMQVTEEFKAKRGVIDNDLFVGASIYSCNLNLWKDVESVIDQDITKIGYGFQINERNQLELIKYSQFNDGPASKSVSKKIATFGNNELKFDDIDDSNYLIFDSMGVTQSSNNGNLSALGTSLWQANADKSIYYINNFVGINKINPTCALDVEGVISATSLILTSGMNTANLTADTLVSAPLVNCDDLNVTSAITATTITSDVLFVQETQIVCDRRVKDNITDMSLDLCLSNIVNVDVYNFNYSKDGADNVKTGFIAQQVLGAIPNAVKQIEHMGYTDFNVIDTNIILANLVGAVKKLYEKINA